MEAWTIARYRRPRLADGVEIRADGSLVELQRGGDRRIMRFDAPMAAANAARDLTGLRDPTDRGWERIKSANRDDPWHALATFLDEWSFIEDAEADDAAAELADHQASLAQCVADAVAQVRLRQSHTIKSRVAIEAKRWLNCLEQDGHLAADAWLDDNFFRAIARISLARLRTSHPPAFSAALQFLAQVACVPQAKPVAPEQPAHSCFSRTQMRVHISALTDFLVRSVDHGADRLCLSAAGYERALSGVEFVRLAEQAMREHARQLGQGRFQNAWARLTDASHPLVIGCYVEEYHVTRRFVEMITPLMAYDLSPALRALIYRYFAEEVGHESFERATCASFGVEGQALDDACPLPLHVAFVDVFTMLARQGPVDFLAAVSITEGMLGEASPLNARVDALLAKDAPARSVHDRHEELNIELNHASIPRLALQLVTAVDRQTQQRALNAVALIFELNFRAWEALYDHYGNQQVLRLPRALNRADSQNKDLAFA